MVDTPELIDIAKRTSVQITPEVTKDGGVNYGGSTYGGRGWLLPAFGTRASLFAEREWYRANEQSMVQGAFTGLAKGGAALPWEIKGDDTPDPLYREMGKAQGFTADNGVEYWQEVLRRANFGEGWGEFYSQGWLDYLRYDTGWFAEIIAPGDTFAPIGDAVVGLAHLDPLRCIPTGDPVHPVIYYDRWGGLHVMHFSRIMSIIDSNDGDDLRPGFGMSALRRAIAIMNRQMWSTRYINARLDDEPPPGIMLLGGVTKAEWYRVTEDYKRGISTDQKPVWGKQITYHTADPAIMPKIETYQFQQSPEKYDFRTYTDIDVDMLALVMNVDRQELMQLSGGGAIGSEGQSVILHQKSKGKTIGYMLAQTERKINDILPDGFTFAFKQRDTQEEKQKAEIANLWGDFVQKTSTVLSAQEAKTLLANQNESVQDAISAAPRANDIDIAPESTPVTAGDDTAGAEVVGSETPAEMPSLDTKAAKSYAVTQSAFLQDLRSLVKQAIEQEGVIGRYSFGIRMREMLKRYGLSAYRDGMAQGGVFVDELDPDDEADYQRVFVDQSGYISGFSDDIYVKKAVTLNNVDQRVNMWGKSLQSFVDSGQVAANANGMFEWQYGMTEHCKDCLRLDKQVHRMKSWYASGWLPRASTLDCKGFNCKCQLVKSNAKARGRF